MATFLESAQRVQQHAKPFTARTQAKHQPRRALWLRVSSSLAPAGMQRAWSSVPCLMVLCLCG
jgi:hypothetical protein